MLVGAKVCDLTKDLWFVCGNFDVSPNGLTWLYLITISML